MIKEPIFRIENGRKIYTVDMCIEAVRRPYIPQIDAAKPDSDHNAAIVPMLARPLNVPDDPDIVRAQVRLISAAPAYPTMGWLGPQRVHYDHDNAAAIRQIPAHMMGRPRPVPVMWNHSYDMHDKAGRLDRPWWEESTDIVPGANADILINRRYDPKAAIGLETGEINATSISVATELERSHPNMPWEAFVDNAASGAVIDGKYVAWHPIRLKEVLHHALVWEGADPNSGPRQTNAHKSKKLFNGIDLTVGLDTRLADDLESIRNSLDKLQSENTAEAVNNTNKKRGGITVELKSIQILDSLCRDMGFDVVLSDEANVTDELQARMAKRLAAYQAAATRYGELEARLSRLAEKHLPKTQLNSSIETLDALAERLDMAVFGESYLNDLRSTALKAFDTAHFNPAGTQSLAQKKLRATVENSSDVEELKAFAAEWSAEAAEKLGDTRTSKGEDMPPVNAEAELSAEARKILASLERWNGGKK